MTGHHHSPAPPSYASGTSDVLVVDEFPMTVTGKVRKVEMREKSVQVLDLGSTPSSRRT